MMNEEYISDDEIRVIGEDTQPKSSFNWWIMALIVAIIAAIGLILWLLSPKAESDVSGIFEQEYTPGIAIRVGLYWLPEIDTTVCGDSKATSKLIINDTIVNDIPLRTYFPMYSTPHLEVGYDVTNHPSDYILFFQAADVRGDNKKIVGAFVQKGELLSRGQNKRGYCAIIEEKVMVGVSANSPLLEKSIEQNGDFFRQYPLVDRGTLVENELKNKSIRRALCDAGNQIAVVETQTRESMHDFAQALVDLGVDNAIYLVGGDAIGWSMDADIHGTKIGLWDKQEYKNTSFIVWPKK